MLLHKSVEPDSRVRREATALTAAGHEVTVVELAPPRPHGRLANEQWRTRSAEPPAWTRRLLPFRTHRMAFLVTLVRAALAERPDVVHAHDAAMLAPGAISARLAGARLVYDAHEFAAGVALVGGPWRLFTTTLERAFIRRCAAVITVSDGIAGRLAERYGMARRPVVVRNATELTLARAAKGGLRAALGIGATPLILHQGAAAPGRGCETLIRAVARLDEVELAFLGDAAPGYAGELAAVAADLGVSDRVHFHPGVPLAELLAYTRDADVGVSLLEDGAENHRLALPNKVFEYIAAGVPVVVSDLPELRRLVQSHGVGWTADPGRPEAVAAALAAALEHRGNTALRARLTRAHAELGWAREQQNLVALYAALDRESERCASPS